VHRLHAGVIPAEGCLQDADVDDGLYRFAATTAKLDIDIEYALESVRPDHCRMTFGGYADFRSIGDRQRLRLPLTDSRTSHSQSDRHPGAGRE
jgi:hypothetical protein